MSGWTRTSSINNTNMVFESIGIGTEAPSGILHARFNSSDIPLMEVTTTITNSIIQSFKLVAKTSNDMTDGFGSSLAFSIQDDTSNRENIGLIGAKRNGGDNTGNLIFSTYAGGFPGTQFEISDSGTYHFWSLRGAAPGGNAAVYYDSITNDLFYDSSSIKYKENIREPDPQDTEWIYNVHVVKADRKDGSVYNEICHIAEEVELVNEKYIFKIPKNKKEIRKAIDKNMYEGKNLEIPDPVWETEGDCKIQMIPILIKELQKLRERIIALEAKKK